jgi:hypothetical protein
MLLLRVHVRGLRFADVLLSRGAGRIVLQRIITKSLRALLECEAEGLREREVNNDPLNGQQATENDIIPPADSIHGDWIDETVVHKHDCLSANVDRSTFGAKIVWEDLGKV